MKDKTIVVTGGTGSIGSVLTRRALALGAKSVIVISRHELEQSSLRRDVNDARLSTVICDVRNRDGLNRIFQDLEPVDVIYHVAAMKHVVECDRNPTESVLTNVVGTQNVVDTAVQFHVPKAILISTDKAVAPINVMGATKLIAERIFLNMATRNQSQFFSVVRFGNVANSRGSVIPVLIDDIKKRRPLLVSNPNVTRFAMRIADAVELIVQATRKSLGGEIFVFKMKSFRLGDLVEVMVNEIAPYLGVNSSEVKVRTIGLVLGEKLHEKLLSNYEAQYVYDLGEFYAVVGAGVPCFERYKQAHREVKTLKCNSNEVKLFSKQELKEMVLEYLEKNQ